MAGKASAIDIERVRDALVAMGIDPDSLGEAGANPQVRVAHEVSAGATGGSPTGGWDTRVINTVVQNDLAGEGAALASNRVTLPAGTYRCRIRANARGCRGHRSRLVNITDSSAVLLVSTSGYSGDGGAEGDTIKTNDQSRIDGQFTLSATSALEVQHRSNFTSGATFGTASNVDSVAERHLDALFERVATS